MTSEQRDGGSMTLRELNDAVGCQSAQHPLETYMGYAVWFDGYIGAVDTTRIVGRWLAVRQDAKRTGIVSLCGGTVQEYKWGEPFDISGVCVYMEDAVTERLHYLIGLKDQAYRDLKKFIEAKHAPA